MEKKAQLVLSAMEQYTHCVQYVKKRNVPKVKTQRVKTLPCTPTAKEDEDEGTVCHLPVLHVAHDASCQGRGTRQEHHQQDDLEEEQGFTSIWKGPRTRDGEFRYHYHYYSYCYCYH